MPLPRPITNLGRAAPNTAFWPRTWRLIWHAAPRQTVAWGALIVGQSLLPVASIYLLKLLVNDLAAAIGRGATWDRLQPALTLAALLVAVMLTTELLEAATELVRADQSELVQDHIKSLVHQQSASVDIAFYESPGYYDRLDQARSEATTRPLALLESAGSLVQNGLTLLTMGAILIPYNAFLPLVLVVSAAPALYVALRYDREYHRWWEESTVRRRWARYFDAVLTQGENAAELRLFDLGQHFHAIYQTLRRRLRGEHLHLLRRQGLARLGASLFALAVSGLAMAWMIWRATQGIVTLGDLALFYQAFQRGQTLVRSLLGNLGQLYSNTLFLGNLFAFLDLKPQIADGARPVSAPTRLRHGIAFRDVTFWYPGSDRPALQDFNLDVPAGKIVAVVGANGAGKTTLIKLLCRFYDPQLGRVELDGIDVRDLALRDLRRQVTVLFQFPIGYIAPARDNIAFGDLLAPPEDDDVEAAARQAGAHDFLAKLPRGYDTLLGKAFAGGAELSGGEWQRVAMARAYFRRAPIVVLDEPTSFMDSWAEADWFDRLRELVQGRTAIIITHRFTIAMRADVVHVMDEGRIVESGSHHDLLDQGGRYAQSWRAQMRAAERDAVLVGHDREAYT